MVKRTSEDRFISVLGKGGVQAIINVNDISRIYVKDLCIYVHFKSSDTQVVEMKCGNEEECHAYMEDFKNLLT